MWAPQPVLTIGILKCVWNTWTLQVKSPTSDILKIEQQVASLPDDKSSLKGTIYVLGLQPFEIDGVFSIPTGGKHAIFKKGKYTLEYCGIVIYLLLNKLLCLSCLHSEVILCVAPLILVELSGDGFSIMLRDFQCSICNVYSSNGGRDHINLQGIIFLSSPYKCVSWYFST